MGISVAEIISRAGRTLQDHTKVRWTEEELRGYITEAQFQIVLLVPDANSVTGNVSITANTTRQQLPGGAIRLLRPIRNMGTGNQPGRAVTMTLRTALDSEIPDWHTRTGTSIEHVVYDPTIDRLSFYIYPRLSASGQQLEMAYSKNPAAIPPSGATSTELGQQYLGPIVDYVLSRAFGKDADYGGNMGRAQYHDQRFYQQLGLKYEVASRLDPRNPVRNVEADRGPLR